MPLDHPAIEAVFFYRTIPRFSEVSLSARAVIRAPPLTHVVEHGLMGFVVSFRKIPSSGRW